MKKNLLILMTIFTTVIGYSQTVGYTFVENFITYKVTSLAPDTVEAIDYDMAGGTDVTIFNSVTNTSETPNVTYSVTTIGNFAFQNNNLTSVTIPDSVNSIGENAFLANIQLTCVISEATTPPVIFTGGGNDSFGASYRSNIHLSIPSGTGSAYAAAGWTGFKSVAVGLTGTFIVNNITYEINPTPNSEVTITDYNTVGGTIVNIPATVNSGCREYSIVGIGNSAFQSNNLTSVTFTLPSNVTSIGDTSFQSNDLQTLTIPDSALTIGIGAFASNVNLNDVVIGNSVTNIGDAAFRYDDLTSITIPASVTNIGFVAFGDNISLVDVFSESTTPPTIITGINDTFTNATIRANCHLHIPPGTLDAYVTNPSPNADWSDFNPVTEDAGLSTSDFELANNIKVITTEDEIKVVSSNNLRLENYTIYNVSGAKIKKGTESNIAVEAISRGIYIIELNFDKGRLAKKIIIN